MSDSSFSSLCVSFVKIFTGNSLVDDISLFHIKSHHIHTWLGGRTKNLEIPGFGEIIRKDWPGEAYGGVALYLRKEIHYERRVDLENPGLEILWCTIWTAGGKFLLGTAYRPPSSQMEYWDTLAENIDRAIDTDLPIVLMGDLNCNTLILPNSLQDLCNRLGLRIINNEPTHYAQTSSTCIDMAITSSPGRISSCYTTATGISNHSALLLTLDTPPARTRSYKRKVLNYGSPWTEK